MTASQEQLDRIHSHLSHVQQLCAAARRALADGFIHDADGALAQLAEDARQMALSLSQVAVPDARSMSE